MGVIMSRLLLPRQLGVMHYREPACNPDRSMALRRFPALGLPSEPQRRLRRARHDARRNFLETGRGKERPYIKRVG